MRMRFRCLAAGLLWLTTVQSAQAENPYLHDDYLRFIAWFAGDYDSRGAAQSPVRATGKRLPRIRQRVAPVSIPALGTAVYVIEHRRSDDASKLPRVLVHVLEEDVDRAALRLSPYRIRDEDGDTLALRHPDRLAARGADAFVALPGCEVFWQWDGHAFDGGMVQDECRIESPRTGEIDVVNDRWRLHADALWLLDSGSAVTAGEAVVLKKK
jgi:hypothetical protein